MAWQWSPDDNETNGMYSGNRRGSAKIVHWRTHALDKPPMNRSISRDSQPIDRFPRVSRAIAKLRTKSKNAREITTTAMKLTAAPVIGDRHGQIQALHFRNCADTTTGPDPTLTGNPFTKLSNNKNNNNTCHHSASSSSHTPAFSQYRTQSAAASDRPSRCLLIPWPIRRRAMTREQRHTHARAAAR